MKYFKSPWRNDNIQKHITEQHELKFAEYKQLIPEARDVFLASNDTTFQPMNASNVSLNVLVDTSIVKTIIGNLLIDPERDEDDLNNAINALSIFQLQENADEDEDVNSKQYLISVGNFLQFSLIIKYIGAGLSFQQCCNVLLDTKQVTGLAQIGRINMTKVISYRWYMCAMAFQMMQDILNYIELCVVFFYSF